MMEITISIEQGLKQMSRLDTMMGDSVSRSNDRL